MIQAAWEPSQRQLRQFAWACPVGFALVGWLVHRLGGGVAWIYAGAALGLVLLALGLARPRSVRPVFLLAMLLAWPIGWLVSNLFAAAFYFLVITPLGLVFRALGRDVLALRGRGRASHWRAGPTALDPRSYYRQG